MTSIGGQASVRVPKAAELVAGHIRNQIIRGELREDDALPSETKLMEQFGISRPTLREAFRILEYEGLITIRRGARGGARVRVPAHDVAARYAGFLLQCRGATLADVFQARGIIEAPAARMLAARRSRKAIVARLEATLAEHAEDLQNPARPPAFHRLVVELTGNQTLLLLASMIEHIAEEAEFSYERRHPAPVADARRSLHAHEQLVELIGAGDPDAAEEFWRRHIADVSAILQKAHGGNASTVLDVLD